MPVDMDHAFGIGGVFSLATRVPLSGLEQRLYRALRRWGIESRAFRVRAVQQQFLEHSSCAQGVQVGLHAWCANPGDRSRVRLGARTVCRGLLRSEGYGPGRLEIGSDVYVGDDCILSCAEHIRIGAGTMLAHGVQVFDNNSHPVGRTDRERDYRIVQGREAGPRPEIARAPVLVGAGCWIGVNAIILKGVSIGEGAVVAAGAVVTADVAAYTVVAGNPARRIAEAPK